MSGKPHLPKGTALRYNQGGIPMLSVHYSADPDRDPQINPEWRQMERKKYSSQGSWDREQEIQATAGGGELVFAYVLRKYWDKIIITDPTWAPDPRWRPTGGLDHGKTNPTAGLVVLSDFDGCHYACGEYYLPSTKLERAANLPIVPGEDLGPKQHAAFLRGLPGFWEADQVMADPSIFAKTQAQADGAFRAVSEFYAEAGLSNLVPGMNDELTGMERILAHWADLDEREPTLKIICRQPYDRVQHGLFPYDCPNLLWELLRTMREMLTPVQLMRRNPSEKIVDKSNHLRDCLKYILLALPEPARKAIGQRVAEATKGLDPLNAFIRGAKVAVEVEKEEQGQGFSMGGGMAGRRGAGMKPPVRSPFRRGR